MVDPTLNSDDLKSINVEGMKNVEDIKNIEKSKLPLIVAIGLIAIAAISYGAYSLLLSKANINTADPVITPKIIIQEPLIIKKPSIAKQANVPQQAVNIKEAILNTNENQDKPSDTSTNNKIDEIKNINDNSKTIETKKPKPAVKVSKPELVTKKTTSIIESPEKSSFVAIKSVESISEDALARANVLLSKTTIIDAPIKSETILDDSIQQVVLNTAKNEGKLDNRPGFQLLPSKTTYKIGDPFVLEFMTNRSENITILIVNSLGEVSVLYPNPYQLDSYCHSGVMYQIPPVNANFVFTIDGPAGTDTIIAVKSKDALNTEAFSFIKGMDETKKYINTMDLTYKTISFRIVE
ncbi:MAG: DUF4384 domain-containing protein [Gammaproteobacteria bacterium]|nr:DUF4384 domain-containing protein [Gammaproteobacteria bacterium]